MRKQVRNTDLIRFFHQNTTLNRINEIKIFQNIKKIYSDEEFIIKSNIIPDDFSDKKETIMLSKVNSNEEFYSIFNNRRTRRDFKKTDKLDFKIFSNILKYSIGISEYNKSNMGELKFPKFTYPTAGGFNSLLFYIVVTNVENINSGIYLYNPFDESLILIKNSFEIEEYKNITSAHSLVVNSFFSIYIVADLTYSSQKYGERSYRFSNLEAGHVGQNIYLTCEYNKLSVIASGGFYDEDFFNYLNIKKENRYLLYELIVGDCNEK